MVESLAGLIEPRSEGRPPVLPAQSIRGGRGVVKETWNRDARGGPRGTRPELRSHFRYRYQIFRNRRFIADSNPDSDVTVGGVRSPNRPCAGRALAAARQLPEALAPPPRAAALEVRRKLWQPGNRRQTGSGVLLLLRRAAIWGTDPMTQSLPRSMKFPDIMSSVITRSDCG